MIVVATALLFVALVAWWGFRPERAMGAGLGILLIALCFAGKADAWVEPPRDRDVTDTTRVAESLRVAEDFWDRAPASCTVRVYEATPAELIAFTGNAVAGATYIGGGEGVCPVWVSTVFAAPSIANRIDECDLLVHEEGHVLGRGHDDGLLSVMSPWSEVTVWGCYARFIGRGGRAWRESHPGSRWAVRP